MLSASSSSRKSSNLPSSPSKAAIRDHSSNSICSLSPSSNTLPLSISSSINGNGTTLLVCPSASFLLPHEFIWRHGGNRVTLTGTFDDWKQSIQMNKQYDGTHRIIIRLDSSKKWLYKYVIDGEWRCTLDADTEKDETGHVNNVLLPEEI